MHSFPNLSDSSFPGISNVNVYGVPDFDYSKFANRQMRIKLMSVPWDMGEVHVGLKSVPMGNVVKFASDVERDSWLDSQPGVTFETRYRSYHDEDVMKLPIPYEQIIPFNYVVIDYDESPVNYGGLATVTRWLYFIRDVKSESMNSTVCEIARDTWSMFINSVEVKSMMLERGHAPMAAAPTPERYLQSPIDNNELLLAEDVNFGSPRITNMCSKFVINDGEILCCFATSAYPQGDWSGENTNDWHVPRFVSVTQDGNVSPYVFAIKSSDLSDFLHNVDEQAPQFPQTVKGVFFVPSKLVNKSTEFTFCGITCNRLTTNQKTFNLAMPTVNDFGFSDESKNLTKLYTYPYSVLELTNENGEVIEIHVEDCEGILKVNTCLSLAFPWINVSASLSGVAGVGKNNVSFRNLNSRNVNLDGRWFETLESWAVPIMAIYQGNGRTNDFATYFDRKTQKDNAYRSADTAKANADRSAEAIVSNASTQTTANSSVTTEANTCAKEDTRLGNELNKALQAWDSGLARDCQNANYDASVQSAAIGAAGTTIGGVVSGGMSAGIPGAVAGAVMGGIGGVCTALNTSAQINQEAAKVEASISTSGKELTATNNNNNERVGNKNSANTIITSTQNKAANAIAAKTASTQKSNASATQSTTKSNASATQSTTKSNASATQSTAKANVDESVTNQQRQAKLAIPNEFGEFSNGEHSTNMPLGMFLHVVKQADGEIRQAAEAFKRFGYMYNGYWKFEKFDVCKRFSYWKCSDIWLKANNIPDAFADQIRNYLMQGVTVWNKPEYINETDLNDNF